MASWINASRADLDGLSYTPLHRLASEDGRRIAFPCGGTPPPARFCIMALRGNLIFGLSRSMRFWQHGYVQKGREREREKEILDCTVVMLVD